jgi:RHS repeat-associated protein
MARDQNDKPIAYYFNEGSYDPITGKRRYYARDHLGSVRDVLDQAGNKLASYDYDPYGKLINLSATPPEFGFAGMQYHAPSGLYLTWFRAYDAQTGRWLSRDPIGEAGGINLYGYVGGDPISWVDLFGLSGELVISSDKGSAPENAFLGSGGTSGHSWISYTPDGGNKTTYGTWKWDNSDRDARGLYENREAGIMCGGNVACHYAYLDDNEEAKLFGIIGDYRNKSQSHDAWSYLSPCSSFAADAWNAATGEYLSPYGPYSNPTSLYNAIIYANGGYIEGQRPVPVREVLLPPFVQH